MTTRQSRDLLDWFRSYASAKFTAVGFTTDASNMNLAFTNDTRVQSAITYLLNRETELLAAATPAVQAFWQAAGNEVWGEIVAQMPVNIRSLWADLYADPDANARILVKAFSRVVGLAVMTVRAAG
jgi:hypothetical protein